MSEALFEILRGFRLDAEPVSCEPYGCGHINATYPGRDGQRPPLYSAKDQSSHVPRRGRSDGEHHVRHGIPAAQKQTTRRSVLTLVKTADGASYLHAAGGLLARV